MANTLICGIAENISQVSAIVHITGETIDVVPGAAFAGVGISLYSDAAGTVLVGVEKPSPPALGDGTPAQDFAEYFDGLTPGTQYWWRGVLYDDNFDAIASSPLCTFTTLASFIDSPGVVKLSCQPICAQNEPKALPSNNMEPGGNIPGLGGSGDVATYTG